MEELEPYRDPAKLEDALRTSPTGTDERSIELAKEAVAATLGASTRTIGKDLVEERLRSAQDLVKVLPCRECHGGALVAWRLATNTFPDKSDERLCEHFQSKMEAEEFGSHIAHDTLGFIPIAFAGTRGLNVQGQDVYRQRSGTPYAPRPITVATFAEFEQRARTWLRELGGKFHTPPSCGCKPHKCRLTAMHKAIIDETDADAYARAALIDTPIIFDLAVSKGLLYGETAVPRLLTVAVGGGDTRCELTSSWTEKWEVEGKIDEEQNKVQFKLRQTRSAMGGMMTCYTSDGLITLPAPPAPTGPAALRHASAPRREEHFRVSVPRPVGRQQVDDRVRVRGREPVAVTGDRLDEGAARRTLGPSGRKTTAARSPTLMDRGAGPSAAEELRRSRR